MKELVSILIPVFNREAIIAETLKSALCQSYKNVEVVVVDNASTDKSWEIIRGFASCDNRVRAFRNEYNIGPVRNWRRCVDESSGEYIKILWSDDLISSNFIEECLPLLRDDTAFVYSGVKVFDKDPAKGVPYYVCGKTGYISSKEFIQRALIDDNVPVSPGCAVFRSEDFRKNLLVDINTKINSDFPMHAVGNDLLLFLLTAKDYDNVGFVSEQLAFFRYHSDSISISSESGKLPLHYLLVKAYFAEKYKKDILGRLKAMAFIFLKMYPNHSCYGIKSPDDFFYEKVKLSYFQVFLVIVGWLFRMPNFISKKMHRKFGFK
jgi:glycosyltransferase involved in cell wall biosynthesis